MSKGNFLLSQARGKVGDIVFTRLDGEQVARAYNAHPKYSNTIAQATNRMNLATISQAYSAFKGIADHSFEGKSFGMQSMKAFMSENIKLVQGGQGAYLFRNGRGVAPNALIIAKGSIDITNLGVSSFVADAVGVSVKPTWTYSKDLTDVTVAEFLATFNARLGDEITLVCCVPNVVNSFKVSEETTITQNALSVYKCRFTLKVDASTSAKMFVEDPSGSYDAALNPAVIGEAEGIETLVVNKNSSVAGNFITFLGFFPAGGREENTAVAVIVSRKEGSSWLRSTSKLVFSADADFENFEYATALSSYSPEGIKYLNHTEG